MGSVPRMTDEPLDVEAQRGTGQEAGQPGAGQPDDQRPGAGQPAERGPDAGQPRERERAERENKGSPDQPWEPGEQRYSDRPEQGGRTPGPAKIDPTE